jgi:hypothetical protein
MIILLPLAALGKAMKIYEENPSDRLKTDSVGFN